jgi:SAM-dependent methyltransferase
VTHAKYTEGAAGWSAREYADSRRYLQRRAELIAPGLAPGDVVLDLACGDGGLAPFVASFGLRYRGVDLNEAMVAEARARGVEAAVGDLNGYEPPEPVAATTLFRALYYARDRAAFFRHVAGYTRRSLVFDLNPRQYEPAAVVHDLRAAGFDQVRLQPFFVPQRVQLPGPVAALARAAERSGPLARALLRVRFTYVVVGSRSAPS